MKMHDIRNSQTLRHCLVLAGILSAAVLLILITHPGCVYGAQTDWSNQHFAIPEYFRTRFYATGNLFPNFAMHLGGGQNIYNFAYYGLYSPVILPSYLFPWLSMAAYLQITGVLLTYLSAVLCYLWLRKWFPPRRACLLAVLFLLAAPVIFHSHHHVMFVSYFPFLFWALLSVHHIVEQRRFSVCLSLAAACILLTSFFFSVGAFTAILLYTVFLTLHQFRFRTARRVWSCLGIVCLHLLLAALLAGILLIPVAMTLLTGRDASAGSKALWEILLPQVKLGHLLYSPFSPGMTSVAVLAAAGLIQIQRNSCRFLSIAVLCLLCLPVLVYAFNGTMYLDPKALIPFLPLLLLLCGYFLTMLHAGQICHHRTVLLFALLLTAGLLCGSDTIIEQAAAILEGGTMLLVFSCYKKRHGQRIFYAHILLFSTAVCLSVNLGDTYMQKSALDISYSKDMTHLTEIAAKRDDSLFRISSEYHAGDSVNRIYTADYYRSSVYSSIHNTAFSDFYFRCMCNENGIRNAAMMVQSKNPVFSILMGEKYVIAEKSLHRYGLKLIAEQNGLKLYENTLAYPIGYATPYVITQDQLSEIDYPQRLEALLENAVVDDPAAAPGTSYRRANDVRRVHPAFQASACDPQKITNIGGGWYIHSKEPFSVTVTLDEPVNELIFLKLHVNNHLGNGSTTGDVTITVNGVRNKLTDPAWKYQNNNFDFQYTLSSDKAVQTLEFVFSAGDYVVSDTAMYLMPYDVLERAADAAQPWEILHAQAGDDTLQGDITVRQDGWFVLSMPYDEGFSIQLDGQEIQYNRTDSDLIGFPISAGRHYISVRYTAPGFRAGAACSAAGVVILVTAGILRYVSARKQRRG